MSTPTHFLCRSGNGQLVVVQHRIDVRQHLFDEAPRHVARRFDGRVEAALVGTCQQCGAEVRLQQALTAAQSDAAAGTTGRRKRPSPLRPALRQPSFGLPNMYKRLGGQSEATMDSSQPMARCQFTLTRSSSLPTK